MPAYNENWIFSIFFVPFIIGHLNIFQNIILATIIENYKKHLKEDIRLTLKIKRAKINEAFEYIKDILSELVEKKPDMYKFETTEFIKSPSASVITYEKFIFLMKRIYPKMPENQFEIIFHILDSDGNNLLTFKEFVYLPDLLNFPLTEFKDRLNIFEKYFPHIYFCELSNVIKRFVNHMYEIYKFWHT